MDKRKKRQPVKFPPSPTFSTRDLKKTSIMILAEHELRRVARKAGYFYVSGFSYLAKVGVHFHFGKKKKEEEKILDGRVNIIFILLSPGQSTSVELPKSTSALQNLLAISYRKRTYDSGGWTSFSNLSLIHI